MKKINLLLILTLSLFILSCDSNDDQPPIDDQNTNAELLIGTWKIVALKVNGVDATLNECELMETLMFNGTNVIDSVFYDDGSPECGSEIINSAYTVEGNIINNNTENITLEILTLNSTELKTEEVAIEGTEEFIYISTFSKI